LNAIAACRQGPYGELMLSCNHCHHQAEVMRSCGHRACNQCQYHSVEAWLERQRRKQLPVNYYLVTFTLPTELRTLARMHPKTVYSLLMQCAAETLKTFGLNKKGLKAQLGLCAVLHTHNRRLDFHPHVHIVVPGGGIHQARREWRKLKGRYLFNGKALGAVFRGCFLHALQKAGLTPGVTPKRWVAHCKGVGQGDQALAYLARYLYRGVVSNRHLVEDDGTHVTFRYRNSETDQWETRRETGEVFIYLLMRHVLPKGFRRARDYGFLHGNAKASLKIVQWVLRVQRPEPIKKCHNTFACPCCGAGMVVSGIKPARAKPG
jgi:hypothetical protein